jgi:hypothetical protein
MHKLYKYNEFSNYIVAFTKLMMKNLVSVKQKAKKVNIHYYYTLEIYRCSYHWDLETKSKFVKGPTFIPEQSCPNKTMVSLE